MVICKLIWFCWFHKNASNYESWPNQKWQITQVSLYTAAWCEVPIVLHFISVTEISLNDCYCTISIISATSKSMVKFLTVLSQYSIIALCFSTYPMMWHSPAWSWRDQKKNCHMIDHLAWHGLEDSENVYRIISLWQLSHRYMEIIETSTSEMVDRRNPEAFKIWQERNKILFQRILNDCESNHTL